MYVNLLVDGGTRWLVLFFPLVQFLYLVSALAPIVEWLMVLLLPTDLLNVMSYLVKFFLSMQVLKFGSHLEIPLVVLFETKPLLSVLLDTGHRRDVSSKIFPKTIDQKSPAAAQQL